MFIDIQYIPTDKHYYKAYLYNAIHTLSTFFHVTFFMLYSKPSKPFCLKKCCKEKY